MASKPKFNPLEGLAAQLSVVPSPAKPVNVEPDPPTPGPVAAAVSAERAAVISSTEGAPAGAPTALANSNSVIAPAPPVRPSRTAVKPRKLAVYIDPAEQEKLSELDIFLRTQYGIRPSESHIMRAALILLKSGDNFVDVIKTLREQDPRRNRQ